MTCIAGCIYKGKAIIGADSAAIGGLDISIRKDEKVFKNQDFLIGCTSSFRMIQLLRFSFSPPEVSNDLYKYMCTDFIDGVRECFKSGGFLQEFSGGDEKGGVFLVGYKDRLFQIESDFQVGEHIDGMYGIGCGGNYALGAMHASKNEGEWKVIDGLKAASHFSAGVSPPFKILTT